MDYYYNPYDYGQLEEKFANLPDWSWKLIENFSREGQECLLNHWTNSKIEGLHCNATWDSLRCWPPSPRNTTLKQPCPDLHDGYTLNYSDAYAFRVCDANAQWLDEGRTNYNMCLPANFLWIEEGREQQLLYDQTGEFVDEPYSLIAKVVACIYFYGGLLSVLLLVATFVIFTYFKTIQCNRISIHKHLVVSFIIRNILSIILCEPFIHSTIRTTSTYQSVDWLCKLLKTLLNYSTTANIYWMFVEGLFLHNRVAISVFNRGAPFRLFYFMGWGFPGLVTLSWAVTMHKYNTGPCWRDYFKMDFAWIIVVPICCAIAINTIFLINIIRILVTKLRANRTMETEQVRKAVKATAVLFPLLGMTNLFCFYQPKGHHYYRIISTSLQALQGSFVAMIYCFMNSEVRVAMRKKWQRYKAARPGNIRSTRGRASRSSSLFITTSDKAPSNSKKRDSRDSSSCSKRGSQDSFSRRKDSHENNSNRRKAPSQAACAKDLNSKKKRGVSIEADKRESQATSAIEERPTSCAEEESQDHTSNARRVHFFKGLRSCGSQNNKTKSREEIKERLDSIQKMIFGYAEASSTHEEESSQCGSPKGARRRSSEPNRKVSIVGYKESVTTLSKELSMSISDI